MVKMKTVSSVLLAAAAIGVCLVPELAHAANTGFAGIGDNLKSQATGMMSALEGVSYLGGGGLGLMSLFKFKQHSESPQQVKLSEPVVMALVAGGLLSAPTFIQSGQETLYNRTDRQEWSSIGATK